MDDSGWQGGGRFSNDDAGRAAYVQHLIDLGRDEANWEARGLRGLSQGWAIGTFGWRRALAKEYRQRTLDQGVALADIRDLRVAAWEAAVSDALAKARRREAALATKPLKQPWKVKLAASVRRQSGAPIVWLAKRLQLGSAVSLRSYLCQLAKAEKQRTTA